MPYQPGWLKINNYIMWDDVDIIVKRVSERYIAIRTDNRDVIASGNIDDVIYAAINNGNTILLSNINDYVKPIKLQNEQTIILDRCNLTLSPNSNDSMFKIYDVRAKIISLFSELNGNKDNQTTEPSSGIRVLADSNEYAEAEVQGIIYIHNFLSQGVDIVATSTSKSITRISGILKTYNNGRNGIYIGYNGELYHDGYIETYNNGSLAEGDGVTVGDVGNKVVLDKVYSHDNNRAGISIWKTNYTKINFLEAYNNTTHGLYIERDAHDVYVDSLLSYNNGYDGIFIINSSLNPLGTKKNIVIRGICRNNGRRGITISFDDNDIEGIILDIIAHDNTNEGFYSLSNTYKIKNSKIRLISINNGSSDVYGSIDHTSSLLSTTTQTVKVDVSDYGGSFANYTPSPSIEGAIIIAIDTNATSPGKRIYVYANGAWHYVDLT